VIGEIAGRIFEQADPNISKLPRAPKGFAGGAGMLGRFNGAPIGRAEGNVGDVHGMERTEL